MVVFMDLANCCQGEQKTGRKSDQRPVCLPTPPGSSLYCSKLTKDGRHSALTDFLAVSSHSTPAGIDNSLISIG